MTSFGSETQNCSVCGASVECTILNSTNAFGSPDLDLRPPEMQRSTMGSWLQECPECRFVNDDLGMSVDDAQATIASDSYKALLTNSDIPELSGKFARYALLEQGDDETAGIALLRAAWACDDANNKDQAKRYRTQAADVLLGIGPFADDEEQATLATAVVDVLRRAGRFDESIALIDNLLLYKSVSGNEVIISVLQFQSRLCSDRDTSCYTLADCQEVS